MNRIDRLTAILIHLQSKRKVTAEEIAERFDISKRTVYRDLKALEECGVPIGAEAGKGYFIIEGYHLPPVMFSSEEAGAFLIAEKLMEKNTDLSLNEHFSSAMYKIKSVLRSRDKDFLDTIDASVEVLKFSTEQKNIIQPELFPKLLHAIASKKVLEINYLSFYKNETTLRQIEPVHLCQYSQQWHLIAYCRLRNEYRDFRIDRIQNLIITNISFPLHPSGKAMDYLFSVMKNNQLIYVKAQFHQSIIPFIEQAKYYYGIISQNNINDYVEMEFMVNSIDYIARWFLTFGGNIEIVEPFELKTYVTKLVKELSKKYL